MDPISPNYFVRYMNIYVRHVGSLNAIPGRGSGGCFAKENAKA